MDLSVDVVVVGVLGISPVLVFFYCFCKEGFVCVRRVAGFKLEVLVVLVALVGCNRGLRVVAAKRNRKAGFILRMLFWV